LNSYYSNERRDLFRPVMLDAAPPRREETAQAWAKVRRWIERDRQPWDRVRFQRAGQGQALQWACCPAAQVEAVRAELEADFGALAHWQVERFTKGRPAFAPPAPAAEDIPATVIALHTEPGMASPPDEAFSVVEEQRQLLEVVHPPDG
jgi:hypothetical protein